MSPQVSLGLSLVHPVYLSLLTRSFILATMAPMKQTLVFFVLGGASVVVSAPTDKQARG